ncbi:MAG: Rieske (2Fe-2S) protein [Sphingomonadaceae bacterium]|uniref:Rieske (2Fe-2S) protein n=1 Tax=Thermaurantiacus sp. TaxID=2820283 RepID=UPI00298EDF52|nr:Rieske (2Fe-2S) protein [Thermaurantiacus sp.]MCS6987160.1 Rieske (2Fe-2S) protein [Sphingomonadaceae bacterium]MDW8415806.1 Rieske (2Fe-2S) protein [Thermaurantiacus sp.]
MTWHAAGDADLAPGDWALRAVGGCRLLVARAADGTWCALDPVCTHAGLPLAGGRVRGRPFVCPHHGARFCLVTGRALGPPAVAPVRAFPVRDREGRLEVLVP